MSAPRPCKGPSKISKICRPGHNCLPGNLRFFMLEPRRAWGFILVAGAAAPGRSDMDRAFEAVPRRAG